MPDALDLRGRRFGALTVLEPAGRVRFGRWQTAWRCRCDCGQEIEVPQNRLPHRGSLPPRHIVTACPRCRRRPCRVCGAPCKPPPSTRRTCSPECESTHKRSVGLESYHRRLARDPDLAKRAHRRLLQRAEADAEMAARLARQQEERQRRRREKARSDPTFREALREYARLLYAEHADEIQGRRREAIAAMTPDERAEWLEKMRSYARAWRRRWRAELAADPTRHAEYIGLMREYRRQRALASLMAQAQPMMEMLDGQPGPPASDAAGDDRPGHDVDRDAP